jgi:hypothetical protein
MTGLHTCLAECAKYGIGTPSYALATSKCYAKYPEGRVPSDPNKVSFWTSDSWTKVSHDLLKYLLECGECTANCAKAAYDALMSTGWERSHKVSDVADTVYNIVSAKWTCNDEMAMLAKNWVNSNLNKQLKYYRLGDKEPESVESQVGEGVLGDIVDKVPGFDPSWRKDSKGNGETIVGDCPRGRQYQAPLVGGCDFGYYREKLWGRDLCICEKGSAAETSWDKLGDYLSGNLKMILIVIVVIVLGLVVMKVASKKVSVG